MKGKGADSVPQKELTEDSRNQGHRRRIKKGHERGSAVTG